MSLAPDNRAWLLQSPYLGRVFDTPDDLSISDARYRAHLSNIQCNPDLPAEKQGSGHCIAEMLKPHDQNTLENWMELSTEIKEFNYDES